MTNKLSQKMLRSFLALNIVLCLFLISCSSKLTAGKVNAKSKKILSERLSEIKNDPFSKEFPDELKREIEYEKFNFKRKAKFKKEIIDSLSMLNNKRILIIDDYWDSSGSVKDCTYFVFNNKIIAAGFETVPDETKGNEYYKSVKYIYETNKDYLNETHRNVFFVIGYFDKDSFEKLSGTLKMRKLESFDVTAIINNELRLYTVRLDSVDYKIKKIQ